LDDLCILLCVFQSEDIFIFNPIVKLSLTNISFPASHTYDLRKQHVACEPQFIYL
jgi:hypothetical protein